MIKYLFTRQLTLVDGFAMALITSLGNWTHSNFSLVAAAIAMLICAAVLLPLVWTLERKVTK